ncbi:MAG TPA: hypothetical protein VN316_00345, partial [candidate division Zixibacteria bacterium]|nr:hypothetical protein [candidate division Zixibacteria bacterium]
MKLQQTTKSGKGRGSHYHFAYLNENTGMGITTLDKEHRHNILFNPPQPPAIDPMTGMEVSPAFQGGWILQPFEMHTHELTDLIFSKKEVEKADKDIAKENRDLYRNAESRESESRKKSEASEKFYMGEQWAKADKAKLEGNDRAALTINEIEAKVDLLSGYQRQNRSDFKFFPTEGGDGRVADILNIVVKNITDQNDYEYGETDVFEDEAITGRGNIHCYIDNENDLRGEVKIEHFPWRDVYYGPHTKKDAADAEYLIKAKWFSFGKVKQLWPDKADEIEKDWANYKVTGETVDYRGDAYAKSDDINKSETLASFVNIAKKEYRLLEIERKEYTRIPVLVDVNNDFYFNIEGLKSAEISSIETLPDIEVIRKPESKIRRIVQAGDVVLENDFSDDEKDFSLIPAYAKKRGDVWWGKVESVKDVQLEINKRHSQSVDILNKMAAYGWFY